MLRLTDFRTVYEALFNRRIVSDQDGNEDTGIHILTGSALFTAVISEHDFACSGVLMAVIERSLRTEGWRFKYERRFGPRFIGWLSGCDTQVCRTSGNLLRKIP